MYCFNKMLDNVYIKVFQVQVLLSTVQQNSCSLALLM